MKLTEFIEKYGDRKIDEQKLKETLNIESKGWVPEWGGRRMKDQDIKIITANGDVPELVEKKLNNLTEQGYKLQSSSVNWYSGGVEGAFCLVKMLEEEE